MEYIDRDLFRMYMDTITFLHYANARGLVTDIDKIEKFLYEYIIEKNGNRKKVDEVIEKCFNYIDKGE